MKLRLTSGNYHIFYLMIENHQDTRIELYNIHHEDFDLVFNVNTSLDIDTVISILKQELRYSPYMYLCPLYQIIPYKEKKKTGTKVPVRLAFN